VYAQSRIHLKIARLQGIPDDFAFYGRERFQQWEMLNAIPPIITQRVAHMIKNAIVGRRVVVLGGRVNNTGANKWRRLDL